MDTSKIPARSHANCLNDSLGSCSSKRSGSMVTRAMCKKDPAVNGRIHDVLASTIHKNMSPVTLLELNKNNCKNASAVNITMLNFT